VAWSGSNDLASIVAREFPGVGEGGWAWIVRAKRRQIPKTIMSDLNLMPPAITESVVEEKIVRRNLDRARPVLLDMKSLICSLVTIVLIAPAFAAEPMPTEWTVDGVEREALVFLPPTSANAKAPVIFAFHGHGGNMHFAAGGMAFHDQWPEAIVIYPQGLPTPGIVLDREGKKPGWQNQSGQEGDRDLKFVDAILKTLREKYSIDESRVYATGFSNGGLFTYLLLSQRPNVFAAFAPGGAVLLPNVPLTQARPVFHYGGKSDQLARFEKQQATIDQVRKFNGCAERGEDCGPNCTVYRSQAAPVETFIHPDGHFYPPAVTPLIVKFFQEHPRTS
jgi:polyhydroxybutyrate depolymerase